MFEMTRCVSRALAQVALFIYILPIFFCGYVWLLVSHKSNMSWTSSSLILFHHFFFFVVYFSRLDTSLCLNIVALRAFNLGWVALLLAAGRLI